MSLEVLKETQAEVQKEIAALKVRMQEIGERLFKEGAQDLFDAYPELEGFRWRQYTPYFNDGDECVFSANTDWNDLKFSGADVEDSDYGNGWSESPYVSRADRESGNLNREQEISEAVSGLLGAVDDDTYKALFGDHVRVAVTRDGIEVEEYEHD